MLPSARRLAELGVVDGELTEPSPVEETTRALSAPELVAGLDAGGLDAGEIDPAQVSLVRAVQ